MEEEADDDEWMDGWTDGRERRKEDERIKWERKGQRSQLSSV